jgi:hypothetical protein
MIAKLGEYLVTLWRGGSDSRLRFAVVCVRDPNDMAPEMLANLHRAAAPFRPDWSTFVPPDLFITFFNVSTDGTARADAFVSKVSAELTGLRIGRAEGPAAAEHDAAGKLLSMPTGGFVNDALRQSNA